MHFVINEEEKRDDIKNNNWYSNYRYLSPIFRYLVVRCNYHTFT